MRELDRVIGYDSIKKELYLIIDVMQTPEKYKKLGVTTPRGVLLDGEPGIGKSLLATCFMKESGRTQYIIRKDRPDGDFVDYIRETFEKAKENEPSIILLDDLDKFANEDYSHRDAEEYVAVQTGIDSVRDAEVMVIATTNNRHDLPDSLLRSGRFDLQFGMTFPKGKDAEKIIGFYLQNKMLAEDIDVEEISRFCDGHSCADLEKIVNQAGVYAGFEGHECITQEDLKHACLRELYHAPSDDTTIRDSLLRHRAIHEAGHAVLAEYFDKGSVNFVTVTAKKHDMGGMVSRQSDSDRFEDFRKREQDVMISLGGKAAVELITGETDMGSNRDMHEAFSTVTRLLDNHEAYDFMSWCHGAETAPSVYEHLDQGVSIEMARYYKEAKRILIENRSFLEALIKELYEKKTLSYKDIAPIREKYAA